MSEHTCEAYNYAETRTPTDMETEMNDGTKGRALVHTQFDGQGRMIWQVEGLPEHVQAIHKMYDALSALGDPVVVAEAFPELVKAVEHIIGALTEDDFEASGFFRSDLARPVADAETLLAKLKARP